MDAGHGRIIVAAEFPVRLISSFTWILLAT